MVRKYNQETPLLVEKMHHQVNGEHTLLPLKDNLTFPAHTLIIPRHICVPESLLTFPQSILYLAKCILYVPQTILWKPESMLSFTESIPSPPKQEVIFPKVMLTFSPDAIKSKGSHYFKILSFV